ncbi:hypothetical protein C7S14_1756 [Burkholderia cepacia]|nr:hypothetical protein C7S14_1756 [Burkholderia cepacia]
MCVAACAATGESCIRPRPVSLHVSAANMFRETSNSDHGYRQRQSISGCPARPAWRASRPISRACARARPGCVAPSSGDGQTGVGARRRAHGFDCRNGRSRPHWRTRSHPSKLLAFGSSSAWEECAVSSEETRPGTAGRRAAAHRAFPAPRALRRKRPG